MQGFPLNSPRAFRPRKQTRACAFAENQIGGGRAVARQFSEARMGSSFADVTINQSAAEPNLESLSDNQKVRSSV